MGLRAVVLLCGLAASVPSPLLAAARTPSWLVVRGTLPFTVGELDQAVQARVDPARLQGVRVEVGAQTKGTVSIAVGAKRRLVPTGSAEGFDAARRVAIGVVDLLLEDAVVDALPPTTLLRRPRRRLAALRLTGQLGVAGGLAKDEPTGLELAIEGAIGFGKRLLVLFEVGWWRVFPQQVEGQEMSLSALLLRAGAGVRLGPAELRAGPLLAPYQLAEKDDRYGALAGFGLGLKSCLAASRTWHICGAAGLDLLGNRLDLGDFATPTIRWWINGGLAADLGQ